MDSDVHWAGQFVTTRWTLAGSCWSDVGPTNAVVKVDVDIDTFTLYVISAEKMDHLLLTDQLISDLFAKTTNTGLASNYCTSILGSFYYELYYTT